jgi:hypothetical protein
MEELILKIIVYINLNCTFCHLIGDRATKIGEEKETAFYRSGKRAAGFRTLKNF